MRAVIDGEAEPVSKNAAFAGSLDGWHVAPAENTNATWADSEGHDALGAPRLSGTESITIEQTVPVEESRYTAQGFVKIPAGQESAGSIDLTLTFYTVKRLFINQYTTTIRPEPGVWTPVTQTFDVVREERSNKNPRYHMEKFRRKMVVRMETDGFAAGDVLYVDDLGLYVHQP